MGAVTRRVRVLLVDDETLLRAGLRLLLDGTDGIEVVGDAADGGAALEQAATLDPDVVLMDVRMPGMDGIEATRRLRATGARAAVIVLTAFDTDGFLLDALWAGAVSFLLEDSPPTEVLEAVHAAAEDRSRFSPAVLTRLVRLAADVPCDPGQGPGTRTPIERDQQTAREDRSGRYDPEQAPRGVTDREREVARLVARGLTNGEIAEALFLSVPTVKAHLGRLFDKLQVTNRVQLAIAVLEREA